MANDNDRVFVDFPATQRVTPEVRQLLKDTSPDEPVIREVPLPPSGYYEYDEGPVDVPPHISPWRIDTINDVYVTVYWRNALGEYVHVGWPMSVWLMDFLDLDDVNLTGSESFRIWC